jgi:hypothetical protein
MRKEKEQLKIQEDVVLSEGKSGRTTFFGKGPQPFLWDDWRAANVNVKISGTHKRA